MPTGSYDSMEHLRLVLQKLGTFHILEITIKYSVSIFFSFLICSKNLHGGRGVHGAQFTMPMNLVSLKQPHC